MAKAKFPMAQKFDILLETMLTSKGKPHSLTDISEATEIAINTLSRFKTGRIEDPRWSTIVQLADYFGIPVDYFRCKSEEECCEYLENEDYRRRTMPKITQHMRELSEIMMTDITQVMEYVESVESSEFELEEMLDEPEQEVLDEPAQNEENAESE